MEREARLIRRRVRARRDGLDDVLEGAAVIVDVTNSPSFEDSAVLEFFGASTRNHQEGHHVRYDV